MSLGRLNAPYAENFNMVSKCRHTQSHPQEPHTFAPPQKITQIFLPEQARTLI